jgi:hypothetical protein
VHKPVFIVDIDVTIADGSHRIHLLKPYCAQCGGAAKVSFLGHDQLRAEGTCVNCDHDIFKVPLSSWIDFTAPHLLANDEPVAKAQAVLAKAAPFADIHYITGRNNGGREVTEAWLTEHFGFDPKINKLLMRKEDSYTERRGVTHLPASLHKRSCFAELMQQCGYSGKELFLFFDDDVSALEMYAEYGIVFKAPECWDTIVLPTMNPDFLFAR